MKALITALFIIFPTIIFGQANYQPGYILKNNGDMVMGYVNYREWQYSPLSIEFKTNKDGGDIQQFTPADIKAFQINGFENYASYVGVISTNKNVFPNLPSGLDTAVRQDAIFLKRLTTGPHLTLYYNSEVNKNRFFIAEANEPPAELKFYEYYDDAANGGVVSHNSYRGQLSLYAYKFNNGDKKLLSNIEQTRFERQDLMDILNEINNVIAEKVNGIENHKEGPDYVRVFAGFGVNRVTSTYSAQVDQSKKFASKISAGMDVFFNPNIQQLIFRFELSYSFFNVRIDQPAGTPNSTDDGSSISQSSFAFIPQVIFNAYNTDKFKLYADVGFALVPSNSFFPYVPLQVGVVFNKKYEVYCNYISYTVIGASVSSKLSTGFGVKLLFN